MILVGDVHGCLAELEALLALAPSRPVIFVGDLVAKGPDSRGVVALARRLGARAVRGNHDERYLAHHRGDPRFAERWPLADDEVQRAGELGADDWRYLEQTPLFLRVPEHNLLVVHGGLRPNQPPEAHTPTELMNMRSVRPDGTSSKRIEEGEPWAALWSGPETVVFGHDAVRGLQRHPHAIGLDTGCVYGGALTGLLVPELELLSVPAHRVWSPPRRSPP